MRTNKSIILMALSALIFSALLAAPILLLISGNAQANSPAKIYPTYKEGTLTVYIDHASDDPDSHYIETVTVTVNRREYLKETYTSQSTDDAKGMVVYSYNVTASEGDVISVTAECSVSGSATETLTVGEDGGDKDDGKDDDGKDDDGKDDGGKDDPRRDDPTKNDPEGNISTKDRGMETWVLYAIVGAVIIIIALVVVIGSLSKDAGKDGRSKNDSWTTCPKCGSDLMMKNLSSHLDKVHPELSKADKEQMIEKVNKQ